ncbi:hypothetical protein [Micromonospora radicis]|nr:hypothetical protein [Micromonospora radicis]
MSDSTPTSTFIGRAVRSGAVALIGLAFRASTLIVRSRVTAISGRFSRLLRSRSPNSSTTLLTA